MKLEVTDHELAPKGAVLVTLTEGGGELCPALEALCRKYARLGARELRFTDRTGLALPDEFCCGEFRFALYSDFFEYRKRLSLVWPSLRLKRLAEYSAELWTALMNEIFFSVPNAATFDGEGTAALIRDKASEAGFIMNGARPVGVYVLGASGDLGEIAAVGIIEELRGRGFGALALETLEARLSELGCEEAKLLVAGANESACALYLAHGYSEARFVSRWYSAKLRS